MFCFLVLELVYPLETHGELINDVSSHFKNGLAG